MRADHEHEGPPRRRGHERARHDRRGRPHQGGTLQDGRQPDLPCRLAGRGPALAAAWRAHRRDPVRARRLRREEDRRAPRRRRGLGGSEMATTVKTDRTAVRSLLDHARAEGRNALTAPEGKLVCDAYGIPTPQEALATSAQAAVDAAEKIGFPVALKIVSRDILHKTEAGGVLVGVKSAEAVRSGYEQILANARAYKKDAEIEGVQVQQMLGAGQEVIIGAVTDPSFGKLVAFGLGGVLVEVLKYLTFPLAPTSAA